MKRILGLIIATVTVLLLPAFRRHSPISERLIVSGLGVDFTDTKTVLSVQSMGKDAPMFTLQGDSIGAAVVDAATVLGQGLELRQTGLICLGETTAETVDLSTLVDYWIRTENGRLTSDIAVCRGAASEWFQTSDSTQTVKVLERSALTGQGVRCRLLDLVRHLADSGDAIIPMVDPSDGALLFHNNRFVTALSAQQAGGIAVFRGDVNTLAVVCRTDDGAATVELNDIHCDVQVSRSNGKWEFQSIIKARATVLENGDGLSDDSIAKAVEESVLKQLSNTVDVTAKAYGCDVCGWINAAKQQMPFATADVNDGWEQHLKSAEYEVSVSVTVTDTGLRR